MCHIKREKKCFHIFSIILKKSQWGNQGDNQDLDDDDEEETFCSLISEINPFWGAEGMHAHLFSLLVFGHVTWVVRRCDEKLETRIPKQASKKNS